MVPITISFSAQIATKSIRDIAARSSTVSQQISPSTQPNPVSDKKIGAAVDASAYWHVPVASSADGSNDDAYIKELTDPSRSELGSRINANIDRDAIRSLASQTKDQLAAQMLNIANTGSNRVVELLRG